MDLMTPTGARETRGYFVFSGERCVMEVEGRPGHLISMAAPSGPLATHPWLHAVSRDPAHEHRLRGLVLDSSNFEEFCDRLVAAGYDLLSNGGELFDIESGPRRISIEGAPVGAIFRGAGQFSTLSWQPEDGFHLFSSAVVTSYDNAHSVPLYEALDAGGTYEEIEARLGRLGYALDG